ncbi:cytochrome c biogenesis protein CcmG, thiol:disulfide interchange protein DsbE [Amycolatopsis marina]|uniref:Cytochrome c biogenesis protein CcmG, thiol:disulfide interchange protein DsbE n=1 Tax=Amycolatopsis marina TaxID=490629 RepID=A0A1I1CP66_9PSEU|nr:redoxin domain-containing protein [Amycolatopsis marina]SFB62688.1 cytochrome c biogenesis protein CcmG, thiol:disulfide interchange protein DsbE [Amycolatopsis marina]
MNARDTQPAPHVRRWRLVRWIAIAVVVVAIGVGSIFGSQLGEDPTLVDSPLIGKPAPTATMPNLEGEGSLSLADLHGQVVVVNFWASWCVACREEHAALVSAANNYREASAVFVGVNYQDQRGSAIAFLDEMGRGDPSAYRYVTDPDSRIALDFGVFGVPETFFLDRTGTVVAKITGPVTYPLLSGTLDAILAGHTPRSHTEGPVQPAPRQ